MRGYLYIVYGERCLQEAVVSATSLKRLSQQAHITIVTDSETVPPVFDHVIREPVNGRFVFSAKVKYLSHTPYDDTLYVDSDTYFCAPCTRLFEMLDYFDACMAPAPNETETKKLKSPHRTIRGFVPYNMGVILYRKNEATLRWLELTRKMYESPRFQHRRRRKKRQRNDQRFFSLAMSMSGIRSYAVPNNWNFRAGFPAILRGKVKLIHAHVPLKTDRREVDPRAVDEVSLFQELEREVNQTDGMRFWNPQTRKIQTLETDNVRRETAAGSASPPAAQTDGNVRTEAIS